MQAVQHYLCYGGGLPRLSFSSRARLRRSRGSRSLGFMLVLLVADILGSLLKIFQCPSLFASSCP